MPARYRASGRRVVRHVIRGLRCFGLIPFALIGMGEIMGFIVHRARKGFVFALLAMIGIAAPAQGAEYTILDGGRSFLIRVGSNV